MSMTRVLVVLLLAVCGLARAGLDASAESGGTGGVLWVRALALQPELPERPQRLLNTQLRLHAQGGVGELQGARWHLHAEARLWRSRTAQDWAWLTSAASERLAVEPEPRRRARSAQQLDVDWAYVQGHGARARYSLGRQPISQGIGRMWSVLDLHAPFQPNDVERLYKAGVDAVLVERDLGAGLSGMGLLSARRDPSTPSQALSAHVQVGLNGQRERTGGQLWMAQRSGQRLLGLGAQRLDWLGADWLVELLLHQDGRAEHPSWRPRVVLGAQYRLGPRHLLVVEALHQREPQARALPRLGSGRDYLGATLSWEPHPLWTVDTVLLHSRGDRGTQGLLALRWSPHDALELRAAWSGPLAARAGSEYRAIGRAFQLGMQTHF